MEQTYKHSDLFLTHTWRTDLHGRNTHDRVRIINEELNRLGFATWFDEKTMSGDIKAKMAEGVDFTKCVMVFVTEEYLKKIDSPVEDNCKYEFDRALKQKTNKNILCVVMENKFDNPSNWFGKLKETLGGCLYVSMSGDLNDKHYVKQQLQLVVEQLKSKGVVPSQTKNKCEECKITNKTGEQLLLFADGDACTFCGENLKKTTDPKNYCVECNVHSNGNYCKICKVHLLDKNHRILELEEQLLKVISLQLNVDLSKYDVDNFKIEIEKMKNELVDNRVKRREVQNSGVKLQINETEYNNKVGELQEKLEGILTNTKHLNATKEEVLKLLEPSYIKDLSELQMSLRSLEQKRKNLDKRADQLLRAKDELQQLQKQVAEFSENSVVGEKHLHEKSCSCDDCTFERELTSKMITDGTRKCIEPFIIDNDVEKVKTAIILKSEIKEVKDENELNLLLSLTVQFGTLEMFNMLVEMGFKPDTVNTRNETLLHYVKNRDIAKAICFGYGDTLLPVKDKDGFTPFVKALHKNNLPVVETMKPFVVNADKEIVQLFEKKGFDYIKELIKNNNITTMATLLTTKPDVVNMIDRYNQTPFLGCCMSGSTDMLKLLVDSGSDVNKCTKAGYTALMFAVISNTTEWCEEMVEYLHTTQPQLLTMLNDYGCSVFHCAASYNREDLVPILLRHSPPPKVLEKKDKLGDTPIDVAKTRGHEPIVQMYENYIKPNTTMVAETAHVKDKSKGKTESIKNFILKWTLRWDIWFVFLCYWAGVFFSS